MTFTSRHLEALKIPIAVLALVSIAGAGTVGWSRDQIVKDEGALATREGKLREARQRFQRSGEERELILRYRGRYQDLRNHGIVGPERRINWLDALRVSNQQAQIYGADYQISTQQPYPFAQALSAPKLEIVQSVMKLSLRLAHEGELMRFIRLLEGQNVGTFEINQCVLDRSGGSAGAAQKTQPNVTARCELAWITIHPEDTERKP